MTDREMLELAAKAAGVVGQYVSPEIGLYVNGNHWNPLTDDGDALRLAVALHLQVTPATYKSDEATVYSAGITETIERVHSRQDLLSATRRAITRAAAEVGRAMK